MPGALSPSEARALSVEQLGRAADPGALSHYGDPAYYSKAYARRRDDIAYYVRLGRLSGGPVLEYGVGNGRIALPLARAGVHVVGVDLSKPMLDDLRAKLARAPEPTRARLRVVHGDMRRVRLRRRFPLVIAAFNTLLHLYERSDVEAFLAGVRRHLAPRGRFVFDFSLPHPADLALDPRKSYGAPPLRHPETGELLGYSERFEYDPIRQVLLIWMQFQERGRRRRWVVPLTHRQFFPQEVEALLHYNGFTDLVWSKDFSDAPLDAAADSVVVSCRATAARARRV